MKKLERALKRYGRSVGTSKAEQKFDKALARAVRPWQNVFKGGTLYSKGARLQRRKGNFDDPMGNRKIKGKRKGVYGRKVLPKRKAWYAIFFARPAKQIPGHKRISFYRIYASRSRDVIKNVNDEITNLLIELAKTNFRK